ncbi:MAG TPA: alpha/beta hydrolase [Candidatus Cybelea sp.]|jgi:pimeloyl-ACP methyl ester carboxylesterase|nr:alpha/beta hydrolase [Candidatus Cybelea sp.]
MQRFHADDGAELAFAERGSGKPALLFIHGWQADHNVWNELIAALGAQTHTVALDARGSGDSRAAPGPYRLERFAADLCDLIETRNLDAAVLVGHSMGATAALRFAVDHPDLTRALVLIAPVPASGGAYSPNGEAYLRSTAGDPVAARNWLSRTFAHPPDEERLERLCAAAAKTQRNVALESFQSWAHASFAEETRAIAAPALVIAPERDARGTHERVADLLPNSRYVELPDCAHYAILERPQAIADLIREFVR